MIGQLEQYPLKIRAKEEEQDIIRSGWLLDRDAMWATEASSSAPAHSSLPWLLYSLVPVFVGLRLPPGL